MAGPGQDHRLGANEAPPAIISIFLGDDLTGVFDQIEQGLLGGSREGSTMELGTTLLPPLPKHTHDRNRTSPFAFTGNKFEFRALGSADSPSFPNTVLNTIAAHAVTKLTDAIEKAMGDGASLEEALPGVLQASYAANKQVVFNGDNYSEEWHAEAESRGLLNLKTTPDALPLIADHATVELFASQGVLSERELESRLEVYTEQYVVKVNIEAETAARIARTMLLPAALRHLALIRAAGSGDGLAGLDGLAGETHEAHPGALVRAARSSTRPTTTRWSSRARSSPSTCVTRCCRRWPESARWPTASRRSWPTTSGRCRSTRRSSSSSSGPTLEDRREHHSLAVRQRPELLVLEEPDADQEPLGALATPALLAHQQVADRHALGLGRRLGDHRGDAGLASGDPALERGAREAHLVRSLQRSQMLRRRLGNSELGHTRTPRRSVVL